MQEYRLSHCLGDPVAYKLGITPKGHVINDTSLMQAEYVKKK